VAETGTAIRASDGACDCFVAANWCNDVIMHPQAELGDLSLSNDSWGFFAG